MAGCDEPGERRHRIFLAVRLGDEANAAIGAWAKARAGEFGNARLSWVSPSLYHLTLHFFGEVGEAEAAAIAAGLEPLGGKVAAPALSILGLDYLPPRSPRTLCLGLRVEPKGALDAVIAAARRLAAEVGAECEGRTWRAHLTLGRFREPPRRAAAPHFAAPHFAAPSAGAAPLGGTPSSAVSDLAFLRLSPESFDLMESFLSPRGPRYETLRRYTFAPEMTARPTR